MNKNFNLYSTFFKNPCSAFKANALSIPLFLGKVFLIFVLFLSPGRASAQLTALFTADDTIGCSPLVVHFTNASTGASSYVWSLGNGDSATTTGASGSYVSVGTYTVTLYAISGSSYSTYRLKITVYPPPTVNFYANDTSACPGTNINFTSTSTAGMWGSLSYTWNFGDGYTSSLTAPSHSYTFPGFYNITLQATNAAGCSNSYNIDPYIHINTPPAVSFYTPDSFGCRAPLVSPFTSTTTGSTPFTYAWQFGDGSTSTLASPTHTYSLPVTYSVGLKVTDIHGCMDSVTYPGYINFGTLTSSFTCRTNICQHAKDTFNNTSSSFSTCTWIFGDGSTSGITTGIHAYSAIGTYTVKLAINNGSCYDTSSQVITVVHPVGTFTVTPAEPCPAPSYLYFSSTVPTGSTVKWLYGDGDSGSGLSSSHYYIPCMACIPPIPDIIDSINMIITDPSGCTDTITKYDTVYNALPTASATKTQGCIPLTTTLSSNVTSTILDGITGITYSFPYPYGIATYSWNFGDGSPTSSSPTPTHTYTATGSFNAVCTMMSNNGCYFSASIVIVDGVPPITSFTLTPTHVCAGQPISFTSTSLGATSYYWYYGDVEADSNTYTTETYYYSTPGRYLPHLVAYNGGCEGPAYYLHDTIDSPTAVMHLSYSCSPRNVVTFSDYSIGETSRLWIFGDGDTSSLAAPIHTYPALSNDTARLTTYNSRSGCRDTAKTYLPLAPPVMGFYFTDSQICRDRIDTCVPTWVSPLSPISYKWILDGVPRDSVTQQFIYTYHSTGYHSVMLINRDNHGCYDTAYRANCLLVAKPVDSFLFLPGSGCGPLSVTFTDRSTDVPGTTLTRFYWTFGNGDTTSTRGPNPTETYSAAGTYSIREIDVDNLGCRDTFSIASHLTVYKPVASFSLASSVVCAGTSILFTNTSAAVGGAYWSFGDGATSTAISPYHIYTASGTYTIRLMVTDLHGCNSDTITRFGLITVNPEPTASFYMDDSFAVCPPLNVNFYNTSSGAITYYWELGDSTGSVSYDPSDVYLYPGLYTIKLAATNGYNCTDTAYGNARVFGYAGAFSYTPHTVCAPNPVHFSAVLSGVTSIIWDFADGVTTTSSFLDTISHVYRPGYYLPKLILTDSTGCRSFSLGIDSIKVDTVLPGFYASPNPVCQNSGTTFHDTSYSPFSAITSWLWSFGSGATSTLSSPVHAFSLSGTQSVTLTATDANGCPGTVTRNISVNPIPGPITGSIFVCAGYTTLLGDTSSAGIWSSTGSAGIFNIGSSSGIVTGLAAGSATVTYTLPTGCLRSTPVSVFPVPLPITGSASMCVGFSSTLSDSTTTGVWSSSATAIATVGSSTGIVHGVSAGTALISYSLGTIYPCISTYMVRINPIPTTITGPASLCAGLSSLFSDTISGGTWISNNTTVAIAGSLTGLITGVASGTSIITYLNGAGCFMTKSITVNPLSPITGPTSLCVGLTLTLADATAGGTWSSSAPGIATIGISSGLVSGIMAGTTLITYLLPTGCMSTVTVTVNSIPVAITGNSTICMGVPNTFTDAGGGLWTSSNTAVVTIGSISGIASGVSTNTATITYSLGTGCTSTKIVTVYPFSKITGLPVVCAGLITNLSDATPGGTWSSSIPGTAFVPATSGSVLGVSAGTALISYSLPSGCIADTMVRVNPDPITITGATSICMGIPSSFADTTGVIWSSSNTLVAMIGSTTGALSGISSGTSTITCSYPTGCLVTTTVLVNPLAPISGATVICSGLSSTLSDAVPGGTWSSSNTAVAAIGISSGIMTGMSHGTSVITYLLPSGCQSTSTVTVNSVPPPISGPSGVCFGLTVTLTESGGGTWGSSNPTVAPIGSLSGIVSGLSVGTATITYSLGTGCITTSSIIVNPISGITGVTTFCAGSSTTLSDAISGGTWSSSNLSVASAGLSTGIISGLIHGTSIITYLLPTGCQSTTSVNVEATPPPITGLTTICLGYTSPLVDVGGGLWTSSNTSVAPISGISGIVNGLRIGTATITYAYSTGCMATINILVSPISNITGTTTVCQGLTTTLTDLTAGGTWSSSSIATAIIGTSTGIVTGIVSGTTIITYMLPSGCSASTTVTVNPGPPVITGLTGICTGSYTTLTESGVGSWSSSDPSIANIGTYSGFMSGVSSGTATITYQLATGCYLTTSVVIYPVLPVTGSNTVCAGSSVILSDAVPGGTWASSNTAVASAGLTSGLITGITNGTATISYMLSTGCLSTYNVLVNNLPPSISGASTVCTGLTTTFTNTATGTWSSSNAAVASIGSLSGVVSGNTPGSATITFSIATGCLTTTSITVLPTPAPVTGAFQVCNGLNTMLSDLSAGGVWSSGAPTVANIIPGSGLVTGLSAGTSIITYNLNTCLALATVTVNPLPAVITGNNQLCVGSGIVLSDSTSGGSWTSSVTGIATINPGTGALTGVLAGTVNITYTLPTGCLITSSVTVIPLPPAISGATQVCAGSSANIFNTFTGGTWLSGNTTTATVSPTSGSSSLVSGVTAGTTIITYTVNTCPVMMNFTVNPLPGPIQGSFGCVGLTNPLTDSASGGLWTSNDTTIALINTYSGIVTGRHSGTVIITYTLPTGCMSYFTETIRPVPRPVSGPSAICQGDTTTYHDASIGGIWSSSNNIVATIGSLSGFTTGMTGGPAQISYTISGCPAIANIFVNPLPAPITGPGSVCEMGSQIQLYDADTPHGTWTSIYLTVDSTGKVTSFVHGIGIVTYTLPSGCFVTDTLIVNRLPNPITGLNYLCLGDSSAYADGTPGGIWSSPGYSSFATIDSFDGVVTGVATGFAKITYTIATGCMSTKTVAINPLPSVISGPNNVCIGDTIAYTDSLPGGHWLNSSAGLVSLGSATGIIIGVASGNDTITYSYTNRCGTSTVSKTLLVKPLPNAGVLYGPPDVCQNATIVLSDSISLGTPAWSITNSNALIAASVNNCNVTGINTGLDTIVYSVSNSCGTASASLTVNIKPLPDAGSINGSSAVCPGDKITLSDAVSSGVWSCTNADATITGGVVTGVITGLDTILYKVTNSCGTATADFVVNILGKPKVSELNGPQSVCVNDSITLYDTVSGGIWHVTNQNAGIKAGVVTGLMPGNDTAIYTIANSCGSVQAGFDFTVNPLPYAGSITGIDSVCPGDTLGAFIDTVPGGIWGSFDQTIASVSASGIAIGIAPGIDSVTYSVSNGCGTAVATHGLMVRSVTDCTIPVSNLFKVGCSGEGEILIYPNPSRSGEFTLNLFSQNQEEVTVVIVDMVGQKIEKVYTTTNNYTVIQLKMAAGVYYVSAITPHGKCTEKLVIEVDR